VAEFRLTVLNPDGRDAAQDFSQGIGSPNDPAHAPINFHAYAACTGGVFHREVDQALEEGLPILLLLRGDFKATLRALRAIKRKRLPVIVSLKETGLHQITRQLADPKRSERFRAAVAESDNCLAATPEAVIFYRRGKFIPTPYPVHDARWNFARPVAERRGVFVGTREWSIPSRNHLAGLMIAGGLGEPITVFDEEARHCRKIWRSLGFPLDRLRIIEQRLPYGGYLAEMSRHRIVLQADQSSVPGQVAGDALLCRMPCVGGNGAVERLAFPETCGYGRSLGGLSSVAARLLGESNYYEEIVAKSQQLAHKVLGFDVVRQQLAHFFAAPASTPAQRRASS
jgi:hypothetical protein